MKVKYTNADGVGAIRNREFRIGWFCFSWTTAPVSDNDPLVDIYLGGSTHNHGSYLVYYRFAPYIFFCLGKHTLGLDFEWFPKRLPIDASQP